MSLRLFYLIAITIYQILALPLSIKNIEPELPTVTDLPLTNQNDTRDESVQPQTDVSNATVNLKQTEILTRNELSPGMTVLDYAINIEADIPGGSFRGSAIVRVTLATGTEDDDILFHARDQNINSVTYAIRNGNIYYDADFFVDDDDGILYISTDREDIRSYTFVIEYTGSMDSMGLHLGTYNNGASNYVAMNLHPIHARRVFPCIDEPSQLTTISFNFENFGFSNIVTNSLPEDNSGTEFRGLQGTPHSWGMVAHNFREMNIPATGVRLYGREGVFNQERISSSAITYYFNYLNEWTNKDYFEIMNDQNDNLHIIALPDISKDWFALSTVCIWEPYILMEDSHSMQQRMDAFIKTAEALTGQWYGYVVYPENWRFEWIVTGLRKHVTYEMVREFQTPALGTTDDSLFDVNAIFTADIIQESLLQDAYTNAPLLEPPESLTEFEVTVHVNGLVQHKAPAILWMLNSVLADNSDEDFMQMAARNLLNNWSLEPATPSDFYESIYSGWSAGAIENVQEFLEPFLTENGYPLIVVSLRQGGVIVTQQRFSFSNRPQMHFNIPLTYSVSTNPSFENTAPVEIMEATSLFDFFLDEEEGDYVLFNVQGQGYYRVNYDDELWERIIMALEDPDRREEIHPLNRATLLDDALNIARAGRLDYDIAMRVVLTMEHETDYSVWKAFIRNMNFLKKRLLSFVESEEGDPDIYLRIIRRVIPAFEREIGFYPEILSTYPAMTSLTRGLVMDHACRANYVPCIAAAIDWFYDPNNEGVVNPDIPQDIKPAVYCAMVKEGEGDAIDALYQRLEIVTSMYERIIILESLACSTDENFLTTLLEETIAGNSPYSLEEKYRIFVAIAESSNDNARIAMNFISSRTNEIRSTYGGIEKLEQMIFKLADNIVDPMLSSEFERWMNSAISNLDTSRDTAFLAYERIYEDLQWYFTHLEVVYEWIDENDAPTLMASLTLLSFLFIVNAFLNF